ncbi:MAG: hypothetical protein ACLGQH_14600 [Acidobacteriota bacterium]
MSDSIFMYIISGIYSIASLFFAATIKPKNNSLKELFTSTQGITFIILLLIFTAGSIYLNYTTSTNSEEKYITELNKSRNREEQMQSTILTNNKTLTKTHAALQESRLDKDKTDKELADLKKRFEIQEDTLYKQEKLMSLMSTNVRKLVATLNTHGDIHAKTIVKELLSNTEQVKSMTNSKDNKGGEYIPSLGRFVPYGRTLTNQ